MKISRTTPAMVKDYIKSLVAESPRRRFISAVIVGTFFAFVPPGAFMTIFLGHYAWSDLQRTQRSASLRKPWLIGVLSLGYLMGLPLTIMTIMDPDSYMHLRLLNDWHTFLAFNDNHRVLVPCIVGVFLIAFLLLWVSPFLIVVVRLIVGTGAIDSKLDAARSSAETEMGKLRAQNQEILAKLDKMSRELAKAKSNGEASPHSGADRLIIP